ncbi:MAG: low molecular weight protein-tyrosine-phosphatase [Frankiaceae bacterium]
MSRYRITLVCMGNICRSPIAEAVLRAEFERAGLGDRVDVDSAGTGGWHIGEDADPRAQAVLRRRGYTLSHAARQFDPAWFTSRDLILALDESNLRALRRMAPNRDAAERLHLLRAYDPKTDGGDLDVPDPYYGGRAGFEHVLTLIEAAAAGVVAHVTEKLAD